MSNPELSFLTNDAHKRKGPDRDLAHRDRDVCVTIVSRNRDKLFGLFSSILLMIEACIHGVIY